MKPLSVFIKLNPYQTEREIPETFQIETIVDLRIRL